MVMASGECMTRLKPSPGKEGVVVEGRTPPVWRGVICEQRDSDGVTLLLNQFHSFTH